MKELVSSVGQVEIVCRFRRDLVSISFGALKPRSCVDFAEIVCQFRQVFVRVRLRFEKASPRWRIVGRDEIEKIAQRLEVKGSENDVCSRPGQSPVDRLVDRCARRAQAWNGRPSGRPWNRSSQPAQSTD